MFDRKLSTNWINICKDNESTSGSQQKCAVLYCDLIEIEASKKEIESVGDKNPLKIQGEYVSLSASSRENQHVFTSDLLLRFLVHEVSEIKNFETRRCHKKLIFWAAFITRSEKSEDFLFDLRNWPLGVQKLNFWK